tara:strand:- start:350 stop:1483 length:1134 start_codon:yes stop_codon:yes gene_type:complete
MGKILTSTVEMTEIDEKIYKLFDFNFEGTTTFELPELNNIPKEFGIGVFCGSSGSGKSSLLNNFGKEEKIYWNNNKSVASHFDSVDDAIERLTAVGLNSIPTWAKPRQVLSTGEGFRADLARKLKDGAVIDEFTSVVNRNVAKSCSVALSKYIRKKNIKNIVLATCHDDILQWLEPDWIFYTDTLKVSRGLQRRSRPTINIGVSRCKQDEWKIFAKHHYLTSKLPVSARCFLAKWENEVVGFGASMSMPGKIPPLYSGDKRYKYRGCRTVILPDFQGLGIGTRLSDTIADIHIEEGLRYFSKTSHFRMGEYRQKSVLWRATSRNLSDRSTPNKRIESVWHNWKLEKNRICYSHEYIGPDQKSYDPKWTKINQRKENQ